MAAILAVVCWASASEAEPGRIGAESCGMCHEDTVEAFHPNPHWKADPEGSCEGCHGPGEAHADEADPEQIRRLGKDVPAAEANAACLSCHGRRQPQRGWRSSEHGLNGLSCGQCHATHDTPVDEPLLAGKTPALCYACHASVQAEFQLTERHPVDKAGMDCGDCHNPHAAGDRRILGGFKQATCLSCHSEYRGPWFFEHEVVAVEGCIACHVPHGSVNRHLLTYQRVGDLCLQCHPEQPLFHDLTDPGGERTSGFDDCTRCHTEIHGSNNDALFLN
jgi:DmsE family decaheme c-type cytochrome